MNDSIRNLAWRLNWWRQSELEGSLLLGRMVSLAGNADLCAKLTRHCAEEAAHSRIWNDTIQELGLPHIEIRRSYQSFYLRHTGLPASLLEVLAFTQIFERRVHRRFLEESNRSETPMAAKRAYTQMIEDEKNHLSWVAEWLAQHVHAASEMRRFETADRLVFEELFPYANRLWEIPGLGRACDERIEV